MDLKKMTAALLAGLDYENKHPEEVDAQEVARGGKGTTRKMPPLNKDGSLKKSGPEKHDFDPNQPRADDGKWTDGGGGGASSAAEAGLKKGEQIKKVLKEPKDAKVSSHSASTSEVKAATEEMFGIELTPTELAGVVGAPDETTITIEVGGDGDIDSLREEWLDSNAYWDWRSDAENEYISNISDRDLFDELNSRDQEGMRAAYLENNEPEPDRDYPNPTDVFLEMGSREEIDAVMAEHGTDEDKAHWKLLSDAHDKALAAQALNNNEETQREVRRTAIAREQFFAQEIEMEEIDLGGSAESEFRDRVDQWRSDKIDEIGGDEIIEWARNTSDRDGQRYWEKARDSAISNFETDWSDEDAAFTDWRGRHGNDAEEGTIKVAIDGGKTGVTMRRTIGKNSDGSTYIENELFTMQAKHTGLGAQVFTRQAETAAALGTREIRTSAAGSGPPQPGNYNGYYTWARFGYDGVIHGQTLAKIPPELRAKMPSGSNSIIDLMQAGGADWWKQNGHSFSGRFDLRPGSRSWAVLNAYNAERAKKAFAQSPEGVAARVAERRKGETQAGGINDEWMPDEAILDAVWEQIDAGKKKLPARKSFMPPKRKQKEMHGDAPGHEFRGNQWTGGQGGGEPRDVAGDSAIDTRLASNKLRQEVLRARDDLATIGPEKATEIAERATHIASDGLNKLGLTTTVKLGSVAVPTNESALYRLNAAEVLIQCQKYLEGDAPAVLLAAINSAEKAEIVVTDDKQTFTTNGKTFNQAGSAGWTSDGLRLTFNVSANDNKHMSEAAVPHEMGHWVMDAVGRAAVNNPHLWAGDELMSDLGDFRRSASHLRASEWLDPTRVADAAKTSGFLGSDDPSMTEHFYPLQQWISDQVKSRRETGEKATDAMIDFSKAITNEGGVTAYAEEWNKDPVYGSAGTVRDPVHRGAHESYAELEAAFIVATRQANVTEKDFAAAIKKGWLPLTDTDAYGSKRIAINRAFEAIKISQTPRPETGRAWLSMRQASRKIADADRGTTRVPKDIKAYMDDVRHINATHPMAQFAVWERNLNAFLGKKAKK